MSGVRWETLIADEAGVVDYRRVRSLIAVSLAVGAGIALILAMVGLLEPGEHVTLGTAVLIAPITAGKISDVIAQLAAGSKGVNGANLH